MCTFKVSLKYDQPSLIFGVWSQERGCENVNTVSGMCVCVYVCVCVCVVCTVYGELVCICFKLVVQLLLCKLKWYVYVASFPGLHRFWLHEGPGIFSYMHDFKGRKVVERT